MTLAPVPEGAAVTIYDLTGQRLRRLPVSAGRAEWDGLDENGRAAGSGVYVVRIASPGGSWTKKSFCNADECLRPCAKPAAGR